MVTTYSNGQIFARENPHVTDVVLACAKMVHTFDRKDYVLSFDHQLYAVSKDGALVLEGNLDFVDQLAQSLVEFNLTFSTLYAKDDLATAFLKQYQTLMGGSFYQKDGSWNYKGGSIKVLQLAGGCFWCSAEPYYQQEGVLKVISGYSGGRVANPTYQQVKSGVTGHKETILIVYDSNVTHWQTLLDVYFNTINPFEADGQFIDKGENYTLAIFSDDQDILNYAKSVISQAEKRTGKKCYVSLLPSMVFYKAEEEHQDYSLKNQQAMQKELVDSGRADKLFDFSFNVVPNNNLTTTLFGKKLVLHNVRQYNGPVTMQLLPFGGIQTVFGGNLVINCKNGFFTCDNVTYDQQQYATKDFVKLFDNLVNLVLPN